VQYRRRVNAGQIRQIELDICPGCSTRLDESQRAEVGRWEYTADMRVRYNRQLRGIQPHSRHRERAENPQGAARGPINFVLFHGFNFGLRIS
jgi:hypothetical protein